MFLLCCLILGGLGSRNGVLLGVVLLVGFDNIISPIVDAKIQEWAGPPGGRKAITFGLTTGLQFDIALPATMFTFSGWRLFVFGVVLILVMRFRPEGLLPSERVKEELHPEQAKPDRTAAELGEAEAGKGASELGADAKAGGAA
jgi:branched-chain amino acid transport system permease protein